MSIHDGVTDIVLLGSAGPTFYHGLPNGVSTTEEL